MPRAKNIPSTEPEHGEPWSATFNAQIMIGPKAIYPNGAVIHGAEGFEILIRPDGLWLCYQKEWWTLVPMSSVNYVRFKKPAEVAPMTVA